MGIFQGLPMAEVAKSALGGRVAQRQRREVEGCRHQYVAMKKPVPPKETPAFQRYR